MPKSAAHSPAQPEPQEKPALSPPLSTYGVLPVGPGLGQEHRLVPQRPALCGLRIGATWGRAACLGRARCTGLLCALCPSSGWRVQAPRAWVERSLPPSPSPRPPAVWPQPTAPAPQLDLSGERQPLAQGTYITACVLRGWAGLSHCSLHDQLGLGTRRAQGGANQTQGPAKTTPVKAQTRAVWRGGRQAGETERRPTCLSWSRGHRSHRPPGHASVAERWHEAQGAEATAQPQ